MHRPIIIPPVFNYSETRLLAVLLEFVEVWGAFHQELLGGSLGLELASPGLRGLLRGDRFTKPHLL